jgi:hypothetical protein
MMDTSRSSDFDVEQLRKMKPMDCPDLRKQSVALFVDVHAFRYVSGMLNK